MIRIRSGKLLSLYLVRAVFPYFALCWLILTVILFVQQAGRYSEIFFDPNLPSTFVWQLSLALVPNVVAFTCPMAVLVGTIIGLSKMRSDNELTTLQSIGMGHLAAATPVLVLGALLSLFSVAVNIFGVPAASRAVRAIAIRSALYKLESPIEPGVFNTEIAGFTVYVRGVDLEAGSWRNVFIFNEESENGTSRLITSRRGRIDSSSDHSELVLEDAVVSTLQGGEKAGNLISENFGELRLSIKTKREELAGRMSDVAVAAEELGLVELARFAAQQQGREATEAKIIIVRRLVLAFSPILFSLLGAFMVLSIPRSGRGFGIFLSLATLLIYFLLTFAGEQLARSGVIPVMVGGMLAPIASAIAILFFAARRRRTIGSAMSASIADWLKKGRSMISVNRRKDFLIDLTTGIRDLEMVISLLKIYVLSVFFLASVFMIFTAFELWRHAGSFEGGPAALAKYVFYLLPFTYLQLAPTSAMLAVLTVFTIKSRQNELVVWLASGQSLYRLLFPSLFLMLILGGINFAVYEMIVVPANKTQESLRKLIRNRGIMPKASDRNWVATDRSVASFKNNTVASDNEHGSMIDCSISCALRDITIYQFEADKAELQALYQIPIAAWESGRLKVEGDARRFDLTSGRFVRTEISDDELEFPRSTFSGTSLRTNQMSISELQRSKGDADSDVERRALGLALQKRYSILFLPLVIALFTAPFAATVGRKGRVVSVAAGVGLWLAFVAVISAFDQFGLVGTLPIWIAVWAPMTLFAMFGVYLISKART
jgi:lipopolysaccharide export LptBFGC system permease protein LptF